ncbi:MAG: LacI family DNA-binding transcriptional regulator [Fibrella sp.]|nr:LacI family DNA-binding transcriptional regulator [Armatimonadota bacterium]
MPIQVTIPLPIMENNPSDTPSDEPIFRDPPRRTRHRDVALRAGVSTATVSKVITGRETDRISEETRQRVLDAVRDLNYVPQSAVREMQTGRTGRIGVLLLHPAAFGAMDPYHAAILGGILSGAFEHRRNTLLYTALDPDAETLRREILGGGADAVIAVGKVWTPLVKSAVIQANIPVVYVSVLPEGSDIVRSVPYFAVDCDNAGGGRLGIEHLASLGHRHVAIVLDDIASRDLSFVQERLLGVNEAAKDKGIVLSIVEKTALDTTLQRIATRIADAPTALFIIEGEGGLNEIISELAPRHGLSVPESFSLVAYNSTRFSEHASVPVTAIRQPLTEIGAKAVEILVNYLDKGASGESRTGAVIRLPVTIDIRASTAPLHVK